MRRVFALALAALLIVGVTASAADAGHRTATNVALGLAAFAVFNQLAGAFVHPQAVYAAPVVVGPPVVYAPYPPVYAVPAPAVAVAPPAPMPTVVQYPHGRYELRGDGLSAPYQWVWIPNPPPPPPPGQSPGTPAPSSPY